MARMISALVGAEAGGIPDFVNGPSLSIGGAVLHKVDSSAGWLVYGSIVAKVEGRQIRPEDRERSSGPDDTHLVSCDASTLAASVPWRLEQTFVTL